jgi:hypothetical protein
VGHLRFSSVPSRRPLSPNDLTRRPARVASGSGQHRTLALQKKFAKTFPRLQRAVSVFRVHLRRGLLAGMQRVSVQRGAALKLQKSPRRQSGVESGILKLLRPVINVGFRKSRSFAVVRMPEAAVHEQRRPPPAEDEVGLSGQVSAMKPKAEPQRMCCPPDVHLGGGVFRLDLRHRPGAMGGIAFRWPSRKVARKSTLPHR